MVLKERKAVRDTAVLKHYMPGHLMPEMKDEKVTTVNNRQVLYLSRFPATTSREKIDAAINDVKDGKPLAAVLKEHGIKKTDEVELAIPEDLDYKKEDQKTLKLADFIKEEAEREIGKEEPWGQKVPLAPGYIFIQKKFTEKGNFKDPEWLYSFIEGHEKGHHYMGRTKGYWGDPFEELGGEAFWVIRALMTDSRPRDEVIKQIRDDYELKLHDAQGPQADAFEMMDMILEKHHTPEEIGARVRELIFDKDVFGKYSDSAAKSYTPVSKTREYLDSEKWKYPEPEPEEELTLIQKIKKKFFG